MYPTKQKNCFHSIPEKISSIKKMVSTNQHKATLCRKVLLDGKAVPTKSAYSRTNWFVLNGKVLRLARMNLVYRKVVSSTGKN